VRSPGQPRFGRVGVAPHAQESVELVEEGAVIERLPAAGLTALRLSQLLERPAPDDVKALLLALKGELVRAEGATARVAQLDQQLKQVEADLARTREHLAAISKGSAVEVARKLGERLLAQEDQLTALRKERESNLQLATSIRRELLAPPRAALSDARR
jgi:hypothetical protein